MAPEPTRTAGGLGSTIALDPQPSQPSQPSIPLSPSGAPQLTGASAAGRLLGEPEQQRYSAEAALGVGATSEVWGVRDRTLDRLFAIKVLRPDIVDDADSRAGFIAEARLTASLNHPNVLPVHDFDFTADGRPYIAMARIDGSSLGAAIEASRTGGRAGAIADDNAIVSIAIAVCNAVAYAHHRGVIHQDIKPDNILLGGFGEVLLLDWGSAARLSAVDGRITAKLYGTPLYMSPEQARGEFADRRSDIYCLGATLFHTLLARLPTWSDDPTAFWTMKKSGTIQAASPAERRATPRALLAIAGKALSADSADRYQSAEDMRRDLERFQSGLAVAAFREPWWLRLRRLHRRHAALLWSGMVACAALALAAWALAREASAEWSPWVALPQYTTSVKRLTDLDERFRLRSSNSWLGPFEESTLSGNPQVRLDGDELVVDAQDTICDVSLADAIRGDVRCSWDYCALDLPDNLNCFIGAGDRLSGFTFHVAGFGRLDTCRLTHLDAEYLVTTPLGFAIETGKHYRFQLERAGQHLRLSIDGHLIIDYLDAEDFGGSLGVRLGIDVTPYHIAGISHVLVERRPVARRVSPLEVGDALFDAGAWSDAATRYREIEDNYPGTSYAQLAQLRQAMCELKLKDYRQSEVLLRDFTHAHPASELAALALARAMRIAIAAKDADEVDRCVAALSAYKDNALLPGVLRDYGSWLATPMRSMPRAALCQAVVAGQRRMHSVAEQLGMPDTAGDGFCQIAGTSLNLRGFAAQVLTMQPVDNWCLASALERLGRFQEILERMPKSPDDCALARIYMGRVAEVANDRRVNVDRRVQAMYYLGDFAGMHRLSETAQMTADLEIYAGRFDEYLARHPRDELGVKYAGLTPRAFSMVLAGRYDDVLAQYTFVSGRVWALAKLGRFDEALSTAGNNLQSVECVAAVAARSGRRDLLSGILRRALVVASVDFDGMGSIETPFWLALALLQAGNGDIAGARALCATMASDADRSCWSQRPWFFGSYILGRIDDAAFLAQPYRLQAAAMLLLAQGLRLDLAGDAHAAVLRYQALMALPFWQRDLDLPLSQILCWRVEQAGLPVPPAGRIDFIGFCGH